MDVDLDFNLQFHAVSGISMSMYDSMYDSMAHVCMTAGRGLYLVFDASETVASDRLVKGW